MKKKFILFNLIMLFPTLVFATPKVTISTSASSIENGKSVTLNVKISDTAAWNIDMSGSGSGSCHKKEADVTSDGKNTSKTFTLECKSTSEGKITFKVVGDVTGQDDDKATKFNETKEVSVTRARSSDNTLKDLKVNNNTVSGFSSKNTSYRINNDSSSISISATANDSNAKVSGTGSKSLKYGDNTFTITVTAENGSKKNYTITVHRNDPRNTNNYLKNLCIDAGSMDFNKNTLGYSIKLEHNINEIVIDAEAEDSKAKITGTGTFKINDYINEFKVVVKAENESTRTYTIKVIRKDKDGNYGKLNEDNSVKSITIPGIDFKFSNDIKKYNLLVEDINDLAIEVVPNSDTSTVSIKNNTDLKNGLNVVKVIVTSESGVNNEFTINTYLIGDVKEEPVLVVDKECPGEKFNIWIIISIVSIIINIVLVILLIKKNKNNINKSLDNNISNINNNINNNVNNNVNNTVDNSINTVDNSIKTDVENKTIEEVKTVVEEPKIDSTISIENTNTSMNILNNSKENK